MIQPFDIVLLEGEKDADGNMDLPSLIVTQHSSSAFSHCVVVKNEHGDIFDATLGGILDRNLSYYEGRYKSVCRWTQDISPARVRQALDWGKAKQATCKGYDILAWLGFGTGIKYFELEDWWYCSEFPYWMYMEVIERLTPQDLTFVYPNFFMGDPRWMRKDLFEIKLWEEVK